MKLFVSISILFILLLLILLHSWAIWHISDVHISQQNAILQLNMSYSQIYKHSEINQKKTPEKVAENKLIDTFSFSDPGNNAIIKEVSSDEEASKRMVPKRAILFTMDSISTYEIQSKQGGAAGELLIRHSLENAFRELGISLDVKTSDPDFLKSNLNQYDIVIVDPWTWAAKGWVPKPLLRGQQSKVYVLDFFGSEKLLNSKKDFDIPPTRLLTAFGSPWNTFLGYSIEPEFGDLQTVTKHRRGVIWGKDPRHFEGRQELLRRVADQVELHSTASRPVFNHPHIKWDGHQTPAGWRKMLSQSKFMIGLGDPLLGPSAIDAISVGCVYINPIYKSPVRQIHKTQHDYASRVIGPPYVCNADLDDVDSVLKCVEGALSANLPPFIPPDFLHENYIRRVSEIFLGKG